MKRRLEVAIERWPLAQAFRISRGSKIEAEVLVVRLQQGGREGWGEGLPYRHFGESCAGSVAVVEAVRGPLEAGMDRQALQSALPPGAARNALDCALWDLQCQLQGQPVWQLAGCAPPQAMTTAYTLSIGSLDEMETAARAQAARPLLKVKLAADDALARIHAVRRGAPDAALLVDANESWSLEQLQRWSPALAELGVVAIEQPLPAGADAGLADIDHPVPLCADESFRMGAIGTSSDALAAAMVSLRERYEMVNLKLDKCGGLTRALEVSAAADAAGLRRMVGCMVATSLALAPAMLLVQSAALVDLDAGLLLAHDRPAGIVYRGSELQPLPALWGVPRQPA